jgi:hypothetical protein
MNKLIPLAAILALSACASPESRVRTGLINAGISPPIAACMAERLVDHLSISQLRRLQSVATLRGQRIGDLTVSQLLERARALNDPEIVSVVTTAAFRCAITS